MSLPEGGMRQAILQVSFEPAIEFYSLLNSAFLPTIRQGDRKRADELLSGKMKQTIGTACRDRPCGGDSNQGECRA